jgi:hypothetical protein
LLTGIGVQVEVAGDPELLAGVPEHHEPVKGDRDH